MRPSTDEEIILLDARAVGSDDEDGKDTLFVLAIAVADDGSGEYSGTEGARRLRRKRAQQKAAAAAAAAAQLAPAVEVFAVGTEAKKETAGEVEHVDADVSEAPDDTSVILTELVDANDDSEGGDDVEGAAPQPALALALAQPAMVLTDAVDAAVRQAEAEGLTLQPSSNATGYKGVYSDACSRHKVKPFKASFKEAGKNVHLGSFITAAEAALARARTLKAQAAAARAAEGAQATTAQGRPKPVPLVTEVAVATQATAEGQKPTKCPLVVAARPGWRGQPATTHTPPARVPAGLLQLEAKRAAPLDDWTNDWKLPAKKRRHALSPSTSPCQSTSTSPAYARAPGAQALMQAPAQAQEQAEMEVTEPVEETEPAPPTESAMGYARSPEAQADTANPKPVPLTAEEAVAQAAAEGLTLQQNACSAGYKGVKRRRDSNTRKYEARVCRDAKQIHLGSFETAEEAALVYARTAEAQAEVAEINTSRTPSSKPAPLTVDEVVAQAKAEGLQVEPSNTSNSGYKGVSINTGTHHQHGKRFEVRVQRAGKKVYLGSFATAEEAALAYARATKVWDPIIRPK